MVAGIFAVRIEKTNVGDDEHECLDECNGYCEEDHGEDGKWMYNEDFFLGCETGCDLACLFVLGDWER